MKIEKRVRHTPHGKLEYYLAEDIDKMLADGLVVTGNYGPDDEYGSRWYDFDNTKADHSTDTHKALLINVTPIKQQTREEQLEEFVKEFYEVTKTERATPLGRLWNDKAKKLLESE